MPALPGEYGGDVYGGGYYGGGIPPLPVRHVRVNFDQDPLALGGVITGDDSTFESLGNWTAGANTTLTLNTATSRVYAGEACAKLTATGSGTVSATLPDQAAITAGRTYLVWAHARPETSARTVRLSLAWKSGTGINLTTETRERAEATTGYIRIGALAVAPPAAATVDVTVSVLGCGAAEVHYVDTVTLDDAGTDITSDCLGGTCTLSGRNHELDRTDAGDLSLDVINSTGWYTPGATTGADGDPIPAPYLGNLVPRRRIWVLADYGDVLYAVWSGHIRRWGQAIPAGIGRASTVTVDAVDGFRWLTGADIPPPYRAEVLADSPLSLYPLGEPAQSLTAGDLVFGAPAQLLSSGTGNGESAFGAATVIPVTIAGTNTDGGSTALGLNLEQEDLGDMGSILDLRYAGGMPPQLDIAPWTMEFWFAFGGPVAPPAVDQILFRHLVSSAGVDTLSGFQVVLTNTGAVRVVTGGAETVATSSVGKADGQGHHVVVTYETGGTYGIATLYVDGNLEGSLTLTAEAFPAGMPTGAQLGGALALINNIPSFLAQCRFQHVAFYYSLLSTTRIYAHWAAGQLGYYQETDGDRVAAILAYGGWPDEDTAIDAGLTPLMPRDWSATNVLALVQDTCDHGGASIVMDPRGSVRVLHRHRFVNEVLVAAEFMASEGTGAEAIDFTPEIDDSGVENVVEVERIGGGTIQVSNAYSISRFGRIKGDAVPLGAASDAESLTHALWRLSRSAIPLVRVEAAVWQPPTSGGVLWPLVLSLQFGDRIQVAELPTTAPADPLDVFIGRVSHRWPSGAEWETAYQLEPALIDQMGVCDHAVYGIADTAACIAGY